MLKSLATPRRDAPLRLGALLLLLVACASAERSDSGTPWPEPPAGDPVVGRRVAEGIHFADRLWLRGVNEFRDPTAGGLISIDLTGRRRAAHFAGGVVDIERDEEALWALHLDPEVRSECVLSRWDGGSFVEIGRFALLAREVPVGLDVSGEPIFVLSSSRLRALSRNGIVLRSTPLTGELRWGAQTSLALPAGRNFLYLGYNRGEFGGGIQRIDPATGRVSEVERITSRETCAGPLDSNCDPVTGLIPDPDHSDCLLASIGLRHFSVSGRILRICGLGVEVVFERPVEEEPGGAAADRERETGTEPIFGLARADDSGYWAISDRSAYQFTAEGQAAFELPELQTVEGAVSFSLDLPGAIVLETDLNWYSSLSGFTPLLVPLERPAR